MSYYYDICTQESCEQDFKIFARFATQELKFYWLNPFSVVAVSISSKREEVCFEAQQKWIHTTFEYSSWKTD